MLSRRAISDLTPGKPSMEIMAEGSVRVKLRLPKSQVAELVQRSASPADAAEKIMELYVAGNEASPSSLPAHRTPVWLSSLNLVPCLAVCLPGGRDTVVCLGLGLLILAFACREDKI